MTSLRTSPALPDRTGRRIAHLPAAILGNGSLLATISARGELERLCWPHVDWGQHLGELRLGVNLSAAMRSLNEKPFIFAQSSLPGLNVLRTVAHEEPPAVRAIDLL